MQQKIICHKCAVEGHKSTYCQEEKISDDQLNAKLTQHSSTNIINTPNVTCFSCYQKGHYANACPLKLLNK